jgi:hypothetical protein
MAVNPNPPAAEPAVIDAAEASLPIEPTPAQVESKSVVKNLTFEIDALWKQAESRDATPRETDDESEPAAPTTEVRQRDENGRFTKAEAAPVEPAAEATPPPAPEIDRAAIEAEARAKIERENQERVDAERRVREEAEHLSQYEAYIGPQSDYDAVSAALRAAQRNDYSLLDALDVVLPNGKKVSQVKAGDKGLTAEEAATLLDSWDTNRAYENVMGDHKVQQVLSYWDSQTQAALADPDVDATAVRTHRSPGEQLKAAIETTRATVTKRLTDAHMTEIAARDKTIAEQAETITSLRNERGNLTSQQRAAQAASPDRPGQPGSGPRGIPRTAEEIRAMPYEEFFKSGTADRVLRAIPGGTGRRRAG